jgi:hypothetical protein
LINEYYLAIKNDGCQNIKARCKVDRVSIVLLGVLFIFCSANQAAYGQLLPVNSKFVTRKVVEQQTPTFKPQDSQFKAVVRMFGQLADLTLKGSEIESLKVFTKPVERKVRRFFPIEDTSSARGYFHSSGLATLQNVSLSATTGRFSIYTELVSDYMKIAGTLVRVSLGGQLVSVDSTDAGDSTAPAIQRFFGAGGNALLNFAVPVFVHIMDDSFARSMFTVIFSPKVALDLPAMNADAKKATGNIDIGFDMLGFFPSVAEKFRFSFQPRVSWVVGSKDFYRNLGIGHSFGFGKLSVGIDVNDAIRICGAKAFFGPREIRDNAPWQVSVQLISPT